MSEPAFEFESLLDVVLAEDPRYPREAYLFVERGLQYHRERHGRGGSGQHVTGPQVLVGVRELAIDEFGPMARTVFQAWNLKDGADVGEIVYNLIRVGLMSKTDDDRKEDFLGVMAFDESLDMDSTW